MSDRNRWNERYRALHRAGKLHWSTEPNALLVREAGELEPGLALDAGCGEGRQAIWLAKNGWKVDAIDYSDVAVEKARVLAMREEVVVNWQVGDLAEVPVTSRGYDLVLAVFLHTASEERSLWLPKLIAAVRSGGHFIYIGHDPSNIDQGVGGPGDPDLLIDTNELAKWLSGFTLLKSVIEERARRDDPGHGGSDNDSDQAEGSMKRRARDTLVVAKRD